MNISKEQLTERKFEKHVRHNNIYTLSKEDIGIVVDTETNRVSLSHAYGGGFRATGCTTIEQIDQLIKIFIQ